MEKEYEYVSVESIFSIYKIKDNKDSKDLLLKRLREGWEIFHSEIGYGKEYIYKMYILRKEKNTDQQKIHEE